MDDVLAAKIAILVLSMELRDDPPAITFWIG